MVAAAHEDEGEGKEDWKDEAARTHADTLPSPTHCLATAWSTSQSPIWRAD